MKQRYAMGYLCFFLIMPLMAGEDNLARKANYQLAGRFAPYKIKKLMYSTSINPKWIEGTENFGTNGRHLKEKHFMLLIQ